MRRGDDSTDAQRPGEREGRDPRAAPVVHVFSRSAVRELDRLASEEYGIPSMVLMENAAIGLAVGVGEVLEGEVGSAVVIAGRGSNGGDGLAAARHLHNEGWRVAVVLAADPGAYAGDCAANLRTVMAMKLPVRVAVVGAARGAVEAAAAEVGGADVVVDALLGTGVSGRITGVYAELIAEMNRLRREGSAVVVAADLPSGLDADSGEPMGEGEDGAVRADVTVTFVGLKEGFLALSAQEYLGEVVVAPIGAPRELTGRLGRAVATTEEPGGRPGEESGTGGWGTGGPGGKGGRGRGGRGDRGGRGGGSAGGRRPAPPTH